MATRTRIALSRCKLAWKLVTKEKPYWHAIGGGWCTRERTHTQLTRIQVLLPQLLGQSKIGAFLSSASLDILHSPSFFCEYYRILNHPPKVVGSKTQQELFHLMWDLRSGEFSANQTTECRCSCNIRSQQEPLRLHIRHQNQTLMLIDAIWEVMEPL